MQHLVNWWKENTCPVSFCRLSDYKLPTLLFSPVHMTAWQPLILLHYSVIFQRCNWESLRLHKSGRLEKFMDALNYCSSHLISIDRPDFKYNQSHLLNVNNPVAYIFWLPWHNRVKKVISLFLQNKAWEILSCQLSNIIIKISWYFYY